MSGIAGLGGMLMGLEGREIEAPDMRPFVGRHRDLPDSPVSRYDAQRALSGLLCGSIDMADGAKYCFAQDETDFRLHGRLPLTFSRFYSSGISAAGLLGPGWRLPWEVTLHRSGDQMTYIDAHGRALVVPLPEPGTHALMPSEHLQFAHVADSRMVVADLTPHYRVFTPFDADGTARLRYIEDARLQRIGCIWDAAGRLARVRGTCGHELRLHYSAGGQARLIGVECVDGGPRDWLVRYDYDDDGLLAAVRNRIGDVTRRFAYRDGLMIEETSPLGLVTRYEWMEVGGTPRVVARSTSDGARERCTYDVEARTAQATDVFGHVAHWRFDARGRVVAHTDFDGGHYAFDYTDAGWPASLRLPGERTITLDYDALGRVTGETDPLGGRLTTAYAFFSMLPLTKNASDGRSWQWSRNDHLDVTQYTSPDKGVMTIAYDADGLVSQVTDEQHGTVQMKSDAWGDVVRVETSAGGITTYERDANGYVVAVADVTGGATKIERDALGRLLVVTRPDGYLERYVWNAAGQLLSHVGPDGQTRHWHRDARGNVIRVVDEEENITLHEYDAHGRRIRTRSGNGAEQTLRWGPLNRLASVIDADGVERGFEYSAQGDLQRVTSVAGDERRDELFRHDALRRLTNRSTPDGSYVYLYTQSGALEEVRRTPTRVGAARGILADSVRFEYDLRGRLFAEYGANGIVRYAYDSADRMTHMLLPQMHFMQAVRDAGGAVELVAVGDLSVTAFRRDDAQRDVMHAQGAVYTSTYYTALGCPNRTHTVSANELPDGTLATGEVRHWRDVHYSAAGNIVQTVEPTLGRTYYDYDRRGCLLRTVSDDLGIEYFTWDAAGNLLNTPRVGWQPVVHANHRMTEFNGFHYVFDAWGQVIEKRGPREQFRLGWDAEGHLLHVEGEDLTVRYQYDALGRRIGKSVEHNHAGAAKRLAKPVHTRFVWQGERLLQELREDQIRTYLYHPAREDFAGYAPLACVDETLQENGELTDAQAFYYHIDPAGTALALTNREGNLVWSGRYRSWGGLLPKHDLEPTQEVHQPLRFAGQYADDEVGLHHQLARVYDPDCGRYLSPDRLAPAGVSPYRYVSSPLTGCNPSGRAVSLARSAQHALVSGIYGMRYPNPRLTGEIEQGDVRFDWALFEL